MTNTLTITRTHTATFTYSRTREYRYFVIDTSGKVIATYASYFDAREHLRNA